MQFIINLLPAPNARYVSALGKLTSAECSTINKFPFSSQETFCYVASLYFFQNSGKLASVTPSHAEIPEALLLRSKKGT